MSYLGSWAIDNLLTFPAITHLASTGALTDADAVPAYRVYEDETGTAILTGNMAKLDDANTIGFYSEQITLSAANGFEKGKCYTIYITAAVSSVTGGQHHTFQIEAEVDANVVSDKTGYSVATGGIVAASFGSGAVDAAAMAADAGTEIAAAVWAAAARTLTALDEDSTTLDLDATIRAAVGLAAANLDIQLAAISGGGGGSGITFADVVEGSGAGTITVQDVFKLALAVLVGASRRTSGGQRIYSDTTGVKDRVTATVSSGDRSGVTFDLS